MNKAIRVAITSERMNNRGYELVFKTFSDLTLLELCTPIVYGSEKDAIELRNALGLQLNINSVGKAEEAQDGKLNFCNAPDDGKRQAETDCQNGAADALVMIECRPADGQQPLLVNGRVRIVVPTTTYDKEALKVKVKELRDLLRRDFMLSTPRIALLAANNRNEDGSWGAEETETIRPAVEELMEENVPAFGPYDATAFADSRQYEQFDGILANSKEQALALLDATEDAQGAMLVEGPAYVVTAIRPNAKSCPKTAGEEPQEGQTLRNAIYLALDVVRHRISYDRPFRHPLQKLYHEKKDDSEKVRFAIPKPKGEKKTTAAEEKAAEETKTAE